MALTQVSSGLISSVANTAITGNIISSQITSVANTQVTGLIISNQIASVANTQVTGLITSSQIASVANTQVTGVFTTSQGGTGNASLTFPSGSSSIGYLNIPQNAQTSAYTLVLSDAGKQIFMASGQAATTMTIPANSSVSFATGTVVQFVNMSSNNMTIAITTDTLTWAQGGGTGSRTLAQYGVANCIKVTNTQWLLTGTNVT